MPHTGEHGVEGKTHKHRDQNGRHNGDAKFVEELANDAFHKTNGQKHGHDGQCGRQNCQANFFCTDHGRVVRFLAHLNVAHDVFTNHNGIVNQKTYAQRQRHQSDHVDGEAKHAHKPEGANQRNWQCETCNDGRAP